MTRAAALRSSIDPATELAKLGPGLTPEVIFQAIQEAQRAARATRVAHPSWLAGLLATAEATAVLREQLKLNGGWSFYQREGVNGALHPDGHTMLMFVPGDRATGDAEREPRSKKRGPRGLELIKNNQLSLFADPGDEFPGPVETPRMITWYVLTYHDRTNGIVRLEVSQPKSIDQENKVCKWEHRIPLEPVTLDHGDTGGSPGPKFELDGDERTAPIDLAIEPIDDADDSASLSGSSA